MKTLGLALLAAVFAAGCGAHNRIIGERCSTNGDGARKLICDGGTCQRPAGKSAGGKCETNDDCVGALNCVDRVCQ